MSAIYLVFNPAGLAEDQQQGFRERITSHTTSYPGKNQEIHVSRHFCAASSHHGVLPSGGVAADGGSVAVVAGSCWSDPASETLHTPAELLTLWQSRPWDAVPQMAGLYSFAYCDQDRMELVVESDHNGSMPLYYRQDEQGVAVASEMKFLLRRGKDKPNDKVIAEYVEMGFLSGLETPITGIHRLPANARLFCGREGMRIIPFPVSTYPRNRPLDEEALAEYDQYVRRYMRRFQNTADRFSISMSGGLDSRLVAYAAKREGLDFEAFTTGEQPGLDVKIARQVSESLDVPINCHWIDPREMPGWFGKMIWFTEGRVHPGHMHYMSANLHRAVPPGPMLHGLGLESVMGGHYEKFELKSASPEKIRQSCLNVTFGLNYWPTHTKTSLYTDGFQPLIDGVVETVSEDLFTRIGFTGVYGDNIEYRTQFKGVGWANPCIIGQVLPWADVVNPFFDRHSFDFSTTITSEGVADRAGQLRWGLDYFPGIADIPRVKSGVLIPVSLNTPKAYDKGMDQRMRMAKIKYYIGRLSQGRINLPTGNSFPQYTQWYPRYSTIRDYVDGILLADQTLDRGYFKREGIQALLRDCRVGRNVWNAVGTLLMVELFLRQFVDGTDIPSESTVPWGV